MEGNFRQLRHSQSELDPSFTPIHRIFSVDTTAETLKVVTMASTSFRGYSEIWNRTDGYILPLKHADMTIDPAWPSSQPHRRASPGSATCG